MFLLVGLQENQRQVNRLIPIWIRSIIRQCKQKILLDQDKEVTVEAIKNTLLGVGEKKKLILEIFEQHNR